MTAEKNEKDEAPLRKQKRIILVPPDGGWGWVVVAGTALSNIFNQSMLSLFSLLYGDALKAMGHETQGAAVVLSTMLFVTNFGGPIAGAILKKTSSRFVAVIGACSCTIGIFLSGFSTNIWHLVFTYGFLLGMGLGFIQNSSFVAINSYFNLRKSQAVGLANVGTGVGQTLMPHLVRYLLEEFGFTRACLILSGLSLHGIGGTLLIQPVERHLKPVEVNVEVNENSSIINDKNKVIPLFVEEYDVLAKRQRRATEPNFGNQKTEFHKSNSHKELGKKDFVVDSTKNLQVIANGESGSNNVEPEKKNIFQRMYDLFDVSLLSSPRFLNIIIGTALAVTSIQNFSMLYPLFLQNQVMMNKKHTANCMSAVAAADIAGRLILPIFQDKFRIKARWMLIMTSVWLIITRQILAYQSTLTTLIVMSALYGFGRSMIIVARNLAISENCKVEQVPAAVGLGMLTMGIIVPPAGYFLGWVRDYTDSYVICITVQNILLVVLLVTWVPDMIYLYLKERKEKQKQLQEMNM